MFEFFLIITPGLESLAHQELLQKWRRLHGLYPTLYKTEKPEVIVEYGGMTLICEAQEAWPLNYYLKLPTRILQRFAKFRARDLPKLYEKIRKLEWEDYLREGPVNIEVSSHSSRLSMKESIQDVIQHALLDSQKHNKWRKKFLDTPQNIFIRLIDDTVTVSLDTSGEALYFRGYKKEVGEAPLRETVAAAMYHALMSEITHESFTLADPTCGTGTILLESALYHEPVTTRAFGFENFPCMAKTLNFGAKKSLAPSKVTKLIACDIAQKNVASVIKNHKTSKTKAPLETSIEDVFKSPNKHKCDVVIMNPPFGERIKIEGSREQYFQDLVRITTDRFSPDVMALLIPQSVKRPSAPRDYNWLKKPVLEVALGGLPVRLEVLKKL